MKTISPLKSVLERLHGLSISAFHFDTTVIITMDGYLDSSDAPVLQPALEKFVTKNPSIEYIIFNLQGLTYIASSGVGLFTYFWSFARQRNGEISFCNIKPKVKSVLETLGFMPHLKEINAPRESGSRIL